MSTLGLQVSDSSPDNGINLFATGANVGKEGDRNYS